MQKAANRNNNNNSPDGGENGAGDGELLSSSLDESESLKLVPAAADSNALLDLLGESDIPLDVGGSNRFAAAGIQTPAAASNLDILDLLGDINISAPVMQMPTTTTTATLPASLFGGVGTASAGNNGLSTMGGTGGVVADMGGLFDDGLLSPSGHTVANNNHVAAMPGLDLTSFGGGSTGDAEAVPAVRLVALDKNGINVTLVPQKMGFGGGLQVTMTATNRTAEPIEQFLFQAAVPKSFVVQMLSPSGTTLAAGGGQITQEMRLTSTAKVSNVFNVKNITVFYFETYDIIRLYSF